MLIHSDKRSLPIFKAFVSLKVFTGYFQLTAVVILIHSAEISLCFCLSQGEPEQSCESDDQ